MDTERLTVRLPKDVLEALDRLAKGTTRFEAVRDAILIVSRVRSDFRVVNE